MPSPRFWPYDGNPALYHTTLTPYLRKTRSCDDTNAATNPVVALAPGTATITAASTADPTKRASVVVNVTQ